MPAIISRHSGLGQERKRDYARVLGARAARKLESVPARIMDEVLARLAPLFE